jgi:hypothetical protein
VTCGDEGKFQKPMEEKQVLKGSWQRKNEEG